MAILGGGRSVVPLVLLAALLAGCAGPPIAPSPAARGPASAGRQAIVFAALNLVGVPYRLGGNTPAGGFDCSGLTAYVLREAAGLTVPRTAAEQARLPWRRLAWTELDSGDLVFFAEPGAAIGHVGLVVDGRRFVHAPARGGTVRLDPLDAPHWRSRFVQGLRPPTDR